MKSWSLVRTSEILWRRMGRDQADVAERLPRSDYLRAVLIEWMKYCTPVERVREDEPHFFFGAPWREWSRLAK